MLWCRSRLKLVEAEKFVQPSFELQPCPAAFIIVTKNRSRQKHRQQRCYGDNCSTWDQDEVDYIIANAPLFAQCNEMQIFALANWNKMVVHNIRGNEAMVNTTCEAAL